VKFIKKSWYVVIFFGIVWILLTSVLHIIPRLYLPGPVELWHSFRELLPNIPTAIGISLEITLSGFIIGVGLGLGIGLIMAYSKNILETAGSLMDFLRPVPIFALIPLFMLWFGIGLWSQILLVALGVSAILGVETYEAIRNIPRRYLKAASNLGANRKMIFKTVVLPFITPYLIGGIRVAAAASWGLDVAAELMGIQKGLGHNLLIQRTYLNTSGIIVIVIIYAILAVILDRLIKSLERKLTNWTERKSISFDQF
jgi:ABC-type nitrate/sulfonate/bicarbonate transport system permease component